MELSWVVNILFAGSMIIFKNFLKVSHCCGVPSPTLSAAACNSSIV